LLSWKVLSDTVVHKTLGIQIVVELFCLSWFGSCS